MTDSTPNDPSGASRALSISDEDLAMLWSWATPAPTDGEA